MYQAIYISNYQDDKTTPAQVYIWDDALGLKIYDWASFNYAYRLHATGEKETIFGQRVTKTYDWESDDTDIFESDLPRETRCLTDLYQESDDTAKNHRILFFDIETSSEGGFATAESADKEITAIGCYAQSRDQYLVFLLDSDHRMEDSQNGNQSILRFDTEQELLLAFLAFYGDYAPTILTGYNSHNFDVKYLYNRLNNIFDEDTANQLSPIGYVRYSESREHYQIAGVNSIDYMQAYKKFTFTQRPSYRLDAIGMVEVNMGKIPYEGSLDQLFRDDIQKFIEYNLQDVRIMVELDKKLRLLDLIIAISHLGHTSYEDYRYSSKFIEGTIVAYLHRQNKVVPDKSRDGRKLFEQRLEDDSEGFVGAYVKDPVPGLHEYVWVADINSLYPNLIRSLNISPESKKGRVVNWQNDLHLKNELSTYDVVFDGQELSLTYEEFNKFMAAHNLCISSNGILYSLDTQGVLSQVISNWFDDRVRFQELKTRHEKNGEKELADYYDRRQHVQKILLNSIYGCVSLEIFRFYDLENALAVTASGQDVIKTSAKFVNAKYQRALKTNDDYCLYCDTDSIFFSAKPLISNKGEGLVEESANLVKIIESELNSFYPTLLKRMFFSSNCKIRIKAESINKTAFWVTKKRYAMFKVYDCEKNKVVDPPKFTVKGLDIVRSSFPPAFAEFTTKILHEILHKTEKQILDTMILDFKQSMKNLSVKSIARNTSVKNIESFDDKKQKGFQDFPSGCPAHVKASIAYNRWLRQYKLNKKFEPIRNGTKVKYVYLKDNPHHIEAIAFKGYDDPESITEFIEKYIDQNALFERELKNKMQLYYDALAWGPISTEINQTTSKFFG